jgi:2,3-bisphosphoglycerate-independent phosphoglycerate mutase
MIKPVILIILDGWGIAPPGPGNAISLAKTPNFDKFWAAFPHTQLTASGEAVGLPRGEDGNSETGHLNLGAGQIVFQDLPRINTNIAEGGFYQIPAFKQAVEHVKKNNSALHLLGLVGSGGVHSSLDHLFALLHLASQEGLRKVWLHLFTDGRDSPPTSAFVYLNQIQQATEKNGVGQIATVIGRYFAMDRDSRWERTQKAYELLTEGRGNQVTSLKETIKKSYEAGKTDEFLEPMIVNKEGIINNNDAIIFFNFRIDRPRQLTKAFVLPDFEKLKTAKPSFDPYAEKYGLKQYESPDGTTTFKRKKVLKNLFFVTMTEYEKNLPVVSAFPPETVKIPLARVIAENNFSQFHISETEKERFVTYYFDGQREKPFPNEEWVEIPSPKVATYDLQPEMSAYQVTEEVLKKLPNLNYHFTVINFANPDMVGHTGVIQAGIKACEVVDDCLGKVVNYALNTDRVCVITADHGNVEEMIDPLTGAVETEHSSNPVPFIIVSRNFNTSGQFLKEGILADVAPTILSIMGISKPDMMTGRNLLPNNNL